MADSETLSRLSGNPTDSGTEPLPRIALPASELAPFMRSKDRYGRLSNMTGGFPLKVAGTPHSGPESLYQALNFRTARTRNRPSAGNPTGWPPKSGPTARTTRPSAPTGTGSSRTP